MHVLGLLCVDVEPCCCFWPGHASYAVARLAGWMGCWVFGWPKSLKIEKLKIAVIGNFCMMYSNLANFWYYIPASVKFIKKFGTMYPNLAWPRRLCCGQAGCLAGYKISK